MSDVMKGETDGGTTGVGGDIRALRKSRRIPLVELAGALGRSVGWLSQVERGLSAPSIADLRGIAQYFEVPISFFFRNEDAPEEERGWIVRAGARSQLGSSESGLVEELLSPDLSGDFEMVRSVFAPGAEIADMVPPRPTQEGGYLIRGQLDLWIDGQLFRLSEGDSFQFQNKPYRWRNPGTEPAIAVWIIAPPLY